MTADRTYPAGVPCWVDTDQPDVEAARRFYEGLFGWTFSDAIPSDAPGTYLIASLEGADVAAIGPAHGDAHAEWNTYIAVDPGIRDRQGGISAPPGFEDAIGWLVPQADGDDHWHVTFTVADRDQSVAAAEKLGAVVISAADTEWTKSAVIRDPQGATLTLSQFTPPDG